jgi:hypothetical protein
MAQTQAKNSFDQRRKTLGGCRRVRQRGRAEIRHRLPASPGPFLLTMRMYLPKPEVLRGSVSATGPATDPGRSAAHTFFQEL